MKCHPLNRDTLKILEGTNDSFAWSYFIIEDQRMNQSSNPDNITFSDVSPETFEKIMQELGYNYNLDYHDSTYGDRIVRLLGNIETKEMAFVETDYISVYHVLDMIRYEMKK